MGIKITPLAKESQENMLFTAHHSNPHRSNLRGGLFVYLFVLVHSSREHNLPWRESTEQQLAPVRQYTASPRVLVDQEADKVGQK